MNTKKNSNQPSSASGSLTASPRTARKSTATRRIFPTNATAPTNSTSDASNSKKGGPGTARKSTPKATTTTVDNNTSPSSSSGTSNSVRVSPRTARKSTAKPRTTTVDINASPSPTSDTSNSPRISTRTTRASMAINSSISKNRSTRSSNQNSSVQVSTVSTSSDPSVPGCSWHGTQSSDMVTPRKKHVKNRNASQDSSDEELSVFNLDNLVSKCVSYFLVADQKKYAVKKQDIIKNVFEHQDSKLYKTVLDKACQILKKTFGLEILNIENRKNEYLLINIIDRDLGTREFAEYSTSELQKQGLVFYLLTLIYMNENVISEDQLWKALEPLGINVNSRVPHAIFGDVRKYITVELVRQMYLEYREICKDPLQFEFIWGPRAKQEVGKEDLLEFACKVMGDMQPQDWVYQYNDAVSKDSPEE